jgi:hypothetical protein
VECHTSAEFEFTYGYLLAPDTASRAEEAQAFQVKSYVNTVREVQLVVAKTGVSRECA